MEGEFAHLDLVARARRTPGRVAGCSAAAAAARAARRAWPRSRRRRPPGPRRAARARPARSSCRSGMLEIVLSSRARSSPLSPGIMTSRMTTSKTRPRMAARAHAASAAVVTRKPLLEQIAGQQVADALVVVDDQDMRGVVGQCFHAASTLPMARHSLAATRGGRSRSARAAAPPPAPAPRWRSCRTGNAPPRLRCRRPACGQRLRHALGSAGCRGAARARRPLSVACSRRCAPVALAGLLHDPALVDELLEDAGQALLGDLQDLEQVGDAQAGCRLTKCSTR